MSRTRKQYETERRLRKFIPKTRARIKRFLEEAAPDLDNEMDLPRDYGQVIRRPHGRRIRLVSEAASIHP